MRAILLARATITSMGGLRLSMRASQDPPVDSLPRRPPHNGARPDDEQAAQGSFAHLRGLAKLLLAAGRSLQRCESEPGGKVTSSLEGLCRWRQCCECRRGDRTNSRNGHQTPCDLVLFGAACDLGVQEPIRSSSDAQRLDEHAKDWTCDAPGKASPDPPHASDQLGHVAGPCATTIPNSARWPRTALMIWVRWRTRRSRVRNTMAAACCSPRS